MIRDGKPSTKLTLEWDDQKDASGYRIDVSLVALDEWGNESLPGPVQTLVVNRAGSIITSAQSSPLARRE